MRTGAGNLTAGWSLMVAYAHPAEPWRNLSIYTGFGMVRPSQPGAFELNGFVTPPAPAPVRAALGGVIFDGDDDIGSDQMLVNGTQLEFLPHEPANNFFRSRIITVRNRGKGAARNVRVCDQLPQGLRVVRAPGAARKTAKRVCWRLGKLASGAKRTLRLSTQVKANAGPGKLRNKAILRSRGGRKQTDSAVIKIKCIPGSCPTLAGELVVIVC